GSGQVYTPPPQVTFEDLGLVLKVTPRIHNSEEVSLQVEAEFKVLSGSGANGIPIIANRKFASTVRLRAGEWAVVAGLVSSDEARTVSANSLFGNIPIVKRILSQTTKSKNASEALIVLKPLILDQPPGEDYMPPIWTGTETRPLTSL